MRKFFLFPQRLGFKIFYNFLWVETRVIRYSILFNRFEGIFNKENIMDAVISEEFTDEDLEVIKDLAKFVQLECNYEEHPYFTATSYIFLDEVSKSHNITFYKTRFGYVILGNITLLDFIESLNNKMRRENVR